MEIIIGYGNHYNWYIQELQDRFDENPNEIKNQIIERITSYKNPEIPFNPFKERNSSIKLSKDGKPGHLESWMTIFCTKSGGSFSDRLYEGCRKFVDTFIPHLRLLRPTRSSRLTLKDITLVERTIRDPAPNGCKLLKNALLFKDWGDKESKDIGGKKMHSKDQKKEKIRPKLEQSRKRIEKSIKRERKEVLQEESNPANDSPQIKECCQGSCSNELEEGEIEREEGELCDCALKAATDTKRPTSPSNKNKKSDQVKGRNHSKKEEKLKPTKKLRKQTNAQEEKSFTLELKSNTEIILSKSPQCR
jgi:hypothetical protein